MTCHAPFFLLLFLIFLFCPALFFENSTEEIELPRLLNSTTVRHDSKIAICLVGELRAFEMTVYGLLRNLVGAIAQKTKLVDVFFSSFLNRDSFKIGILQKEFENFVSETSIHNVKIAIVNMPLQSPSYFSSVPSNIMPYATSGTEAMYGVFNLTSTCSKLIQKHEGTQKYQYDIILKTRVDGLWYFPTVGLPLTKGDFKGTVLLPRRESYYGYNDRFLIGPRGLMLLAMDRFRSIQIANTTRAINSEASLKNELDTIKMKVTKMKPCPSIESCVTPFCVLRTIEPSVNAMKVKKHFITDGGVCKPCLAHCKYKGLGRDWTKIFEEEIGPAPLLPLSTLENLTLQIQDIPSCVEIFTKALQKLNWRSDVSMTDLCIISSFSLLTRKESFRITNSSDPRLIHMLSEPALRAAKAWNYEEDRCQRFPVFCHQIPFD